MGIFNGPWLSKEEHERFVHLNLIGHVNSLELNNSELQAKLQLAESRIAELEKALQGMIDMSIGVAEHDDITMIRQARKALLYTAADREAQDRALGEKDE